MWTTRSSEEGRTRAPRLTIPVLAALAGVAGPACGTTDEGGVDAGIEPNRDASTEPGPDGGDAPDGGEGSDVWAAVDRAVEDGPIADVSFLVGTVDGPRHQKELGDSTIDTVYHIASGSKWVTGTVLLTLVEDGTMSLDERPERTLDWWRPGSADPRSRITLAHLLSFRSGLPVDHACLLVGLDFEACARRIYDDAEGDTFPPGERFEYGTAHMQIAALMAMKATGASDFNEVFRETIGDSLGLSDTMRYDFPRDVLPWASAGISTNAETYGLFLRAILAREVIATELAEMEDDQVGDDTIIEFSPIADLGQEWRYGFGLWVECQGSNFEASCLDGVRSSPGAFGFYPWIDRQAGYWAIVASENHSDAGDELVFAPAIELGQELAPLIVEALNSD